MSKLMALQGGVEPSPEALAFAERVRELTA